mmetsp:Transcript_37508/g.120327  ORF Transcript_37508/g.120327 Transcript_37508/m.120327 type:complete len:121 (-) Transcript_37508:1230-1592(-)
MRRAQRPTSDHADLLVEFVGTLIVDRRSLDDAEAVLRLVADLAQNELPRWNAVIADVTHRAQAIVRDAFDGATLDLRRHLISPAKRRTGRDTSFSSEQQQQQQGPLSPLSVYSDSYFLDR